METRIQLYGDVTVNACHGTPPRLDCAKKWLARIDRVSEYRQTVSDLVTTGLIINRTLLIAFQL